MRIFSIRQSVVILGLSISSLMAEIDVSSMIKDIGQYHQLSKENQETVLNGLSGKSWKKLTDQQRKDVQLACYAASKSLIGKNAKGKLKVVKDPGEKQILKVAGNYLNGLPAEKVPAHPAAEDLFGEIPKKIGRASCRERV